MSVDALVPPPMPPGAEKFGAWWDERSASAAAAFFPRYLRHTEGEWAGKPFELAPWQRDRVIRPTYGWKRDDGTRLIRTVWLEVPRKNGKTELAAGISLLALVGDAEQGGQVYSLAVDKDQASLVFGKAAAMVAMSEELRKLLEIYKTSIFCPSLSATFKPLSKGAGGKHGFSPSAAIGDEVHEWTDNGELADVVHKGTAARRQALEVYTTTAGVTGAGYGWTMHELAVSILNGQVIDPTFLPVIFAIPEGADWQDEATWRAANPSYGITPKAEFIREEAKKAARSPAAENDFRRFHLNQWTEQAVRWLPMGSPGWRDCTEAPGDRDLWRRLPERMRGRPCWGGLDLSQTRDITALVWKFPAARWGEREVLVCRFWLPRASIANEPLGRRRRYEQLAEMGAITLMDGNVVDYAFIEQSILEDAQLFQPAWLGIDPANASDLALRLKDRHGLPVEFFRQGFLSMSPAAKHWERQVIAGELEHGNDPVLTWMAGNAVVERDAIGNIKPAKARAADKIDGVVAGVIATGGLLVKPGAVSIYESRGLLAV